MLVEGVELRLKRSSSGLMFVLLWNMAQLSGALTAASTHLRKTIGDRQEQFSGHGQTWQILPMVTISNGTRWHVR